MALHEQSVGATDEWYTPPEIFDAMGVRFDMDVASPGQCFTPWLPADEFLTWGSLEREWTGFVWMNPPFGARNGLVPWLEKFFAHGDGVALVPDRTSAPWFIRFAAMADAILFIGKPAPPKGESNKVKFIRPDGSRGASPAQGTALFASGRRGFAALNYARMAGLGLYVKPSNTRGLFPFQPLTEPADAPLEGVISGQAPEEPLPNSQDPRP